MNHNLFVSRCVTIQANQERVWDTLTNPKMIKEYLFGTHVETDWRIASDITFKGEHRGLPYTDKGVVVEYIKNESLKYNYWSHSSGLEDKKENYALVAYNIEALDENQVALTWYQKGFPSQEGLYHTEEALESILESIKELSEA